MRRGRQLLLRPLLAALLGVVAATLVIGAALLLLQVSPESDEPWGELGQIFLGVLLAGVVGVVVWVAGLARAARHLFAPGRRLGVVLWSTFAILTLAVALGVAGGAVDADRLGDEVGRGLLGAGFVLMVAAPSGIFRLWDRRPRNSAVATLGRVSQALAPRKAAGLSGCDLHVNGRGRCPPHRSGARASPVPRRLNCRS